MAKDAIPAADVALIRDIIAGLVPDSDALDAETLADIAAGNPITYHTHDGAAALDLTQVVHELQVWVPIVSGLLTAAKTLRDLAAGSAKPAPSADEIEQAYISGHGPPPPGRAAKLRDAARQVAARRR